ncbi:response regulator transcription factor [Flavobacteriaceae bacterium TK19130]|nr:response regulator transcription factor [Thermobacterium salinum]
MKQTANYPIAIVDDHFLFASSLSKLVNSYESFTVQFQATNGKDLQQKLETAEQLPKIILLDIKMPVMDGFETAVWLQEHYPDIKILALSMEDDENTILRMLRLGANGYLLKDIHPDKLKVALEEVIQKGFYHTEKVAEHLLHSLHQPAKPDKDDFRENELIFMQLASTEMTYSQIASEMNLSPKTIDGYRHELFNRLEVKNRVGLVMYALKNGLIEF